MSRAWKSKSTHKKNLINKYFKNIYMFIFLAASGLSCSMWDLLLLFSQALLRRLLWLWCAGSRAYVLSSCGVWAQCCCSVAQSSPALCDPMDCSMPGFPVHHHLLELAQTHVLWISDAIQWSHPLSSPFPPAFSLSQHQGLFQWVGSSHQVAEVLELQHQSSQWKFRVDFL